MRKKTNKEILDSLNESLKMSPEKDRLRWCPNCQIFHLVEHRGSDFCEGCNDEYNNRKKKLDKLYSGGPIEDLEGKFEKFLIDDDLFKAPTIEEMANENEKLLDQVEKLIKQNKALITERDAARLDRDLTVKQKDSIIAEREATIAKQLALEKEKDVIISQQTQKLLEFEKTTDQGKKDFILWCLVTGAIKTALLQSKGAVIDTWNGTAKLYGFNFIKKYMRDEYVLSPGQSIN